MKNERRKKGERREKRKRRGFRTTQAARSSIIAAARGVATHKFWRLGVSSLKGSNQFHNLMAIS
mgnify:CR=1 FL=1